MNEAVKLILLLSLSGSILALLMFIIKPFITNKFSKSIQYYIWIIVILRFILPFSYEGSFMNKAFYEEDFNEISYQSMIVSMEHRNNAIYNKLNLFKEPEGEFNQAYVSKFDQQNLRDLLNKYLFYFWLLGTVTVLTINLTGYLRFSKHLKKTNEQATYEQKRILDALLDTKKNGVRLYRNRFVTSPLLIGMLRPCIIIPDTYFDEDQLKNILLHETIHLKRYDIAVKWILMIVSAIHWFNPFMYFIKKELNRICELSCDEELIKNLSSKEKQAYGDTLISVITEYRFPNELQATICAEKRNMQDRLIAIMNYNEKSDLIRVFSVFLFVFILFSAVYLGVGGKRVIVNKVETIVIMQHTIPIIHNYEKKENNEIFFIEDIPVNPGYINNVKGYKIKYIVDGSEKTGNIFRPKAEGQFPVMIINRENAEGSVSKSQQDYINTLINYFAAQNYLVVIPQSMENDVHNLISLAQTLDSVDVNNISLFGVIKKEPVTFFSVQSVIPFGTEAIINHTTDLNNSNQVSPFLFMRIKNSTIYNASAKQEIFIKSTVTSKDQVKNLSGVNERIGNVWYTEGIVAKLVQFNKEFQKF